MSTQSTTTPANNSKGLCFYANGISISEMEQVSFSTDKINNLLALGVKFYVRLFTAKGCKIDSKKSIKINKKNLLLKESGKSYTAEILFDARALEPKQLAYLKIGKLGTLSGLFVAVPKDIDDSQLKIHNGSIWCELTEDFGQLPSF